MTLRTVSAVAMAMSASCEGVGSITSAGSAMASTPCAPHSSACVQTIITPEAVLISVRMPMVR